MITSAEKSLKLVEFGVYSFDLDNGELKKQGKPVRLRPKARLFLQLLIEADGALVPHEKLYSAIWHGRVVLGLDGLHQLAKDARKALAGCKVNPVINVPGAGYRFEAQLLAPMTLSGNRRHSSRMAYLGGLATLPVAFLAYCLMLASGVFN